MTKIGIYQIEIDVHVGVTEEERSVPQPISVDMELTGLISTTSDNIDQTIDYDALCRQVIAIGHQARVSLVETLAEEMAQKALLDLRVTSVLVRVTKKNPPLKEIRGGFVVEIVRHRDRDDKGGRARIENVADQSG